MIDCVEFGIRYPFSDVKAEVSCSERDVAKSLVSAFKALRKFVSYPSTFGSTKLRRWLNLSGVILRKQKEYVWSCVTSLYNVSKSPYFPDV